MRGERGRGGTIAHLVICRLEKGKHDDELYAVTGGVGALGVVIELFIQCVQKFKLEKQITIVEQSIVRDSITFYHSPPLLPSSPSSPSSLSFPFSLCSSTTPTPAIVIGPI